MGATIYPAEYVEMKLGDEWRYVLDSVVEPNTVEDPDYGTVTLGSPWEIHLGYSTIMGLLPLLAYGVDPEQYSGVYEISDFCGRLEALYESDNWDHLTERQADLMDALLRVCYYGSRNGATHIAWS